MKTSIPFGLVAARARLSDGSEGPRNRLLAVQARAQVWLTSLSSAQWANFPAPRHYGRAAVFLASDEAEMITGFDLRVDASAIAKY